MLFTALVPMPLIAWAVRPVGWVGPQVVAVAAGVMVAGIAAAAWGQVLVAVDNNCNDHHWRAIVCVYLTKPLIG